MHKKNGLKALKLYVITSHRRNFMKRKKMNPKLEEEGGGNARKMHNIYLCFFITHAKLFSDTTICIFQGEQEGADRSKVQGEPLVQAHWLRLGGRVLLLAQI